MIFHLFLSPKVYLHGEKGLEREAVGGGGGGGGMMFRCGVNV